MKNCYSQITVNKRMQSDVAYGHAANAKRSARKTTMIKLENLK
jgi:hypothetical protein